MACNSTKAFMAHMDELNSPVKLIVEDEEGDVLGTSYKTEHISLKLLISISDDKYLSIHGRDYIKVPMSKLREIINLCNKLNNEYRWVKFVCDEEKCSVILKADHIINPETAVDYITEIMDCMMDISDEAYPEFMKVIWAA